MVLAGLSGALAINVTTAVINDHHGVLGPAVLSQANAVAAAVGLVSPLAVGAATALGWTWRAALLVTVPLAGISFALISRQRTVPAYNAVPPGTQGFSRSRAVLGDLAGGAGRGRCGGGGILFGDLDTGPAVRPDRCRAGYRDRCRRSRRRGDGRRTLPDRLAGQAGVHRSGCSSLVWAVTVAGWSVVWTTTSVTVAILGLLIVGIGIAGQFPLGISMVMAFSRGEPDRAVAVSSIGFGAASGSRAVRARRAGRRLRREDGLPGGAGVLRARRGRRDRRAAQRPARHSPRFAAGRHRLISDSRRPR